MCLRGVGGGGGALEAGVEVRWEARDFGDVLEGWCYCEVKGPPGLGKHKACGHE